MSGAEQHKPTKANRMRQLLRESEWTAHALAVAADAVPSQAWRLIDSELKRGNVEMVGYTKNGQCRLYIWSGDDDIITMSIRAAEYLREHSKDQLGLSLANHLMRLSGASTQPDGSQIMEKS